MDFSISASRPLRIFFLPFVFPSHMMPLFEISRLFAARGQRVTVITIPAIASVLQPTVDADAASGHDIRLHCLVPPPSSVPLDQLHKITDRSTAFEASKAFNLLRPQIEEFVAANCPDCLVSDIMYPWTAEIGVTRLMFHVTSVITLCLENAVDSPDSPHWELDSDYEPFVVPGLPDPITLTRSRLPIQCRNRDPEAEGLGQFVGQLKRSESNSFGILVNSFEELEQAYTQHYSKSTSSRIFNIGPVALFQQIAGEKGDKIYKAAIEENDCLSWLDSRKPKSVVYVSFGTTCVFRDDQLTEMAHGLANSGHDFVWVVQHKDGAGGDWLPEGFEERTRGRGLIVRGWAPQLLILNHPSVGVFLSHCGWNALTEAVCAGVPMITWPVHAEQFYNEKLVTQVLKVGVEVGSMDWKLYPNDESKRPVTRDMIASAVRRLLSGDGEVQKMREKLAELRETARRAVQEGGSSHNNLTVLIEELQRARDGKAGEKNRNNGGTANGPELASDPIQ